MNEYLLERIFEKVEHLPPFPKVAQKALAILKKEEVNYEELERIIKADPSIATNFLKLVNSAAFSLPQKVNSLMKAFMFLGTNQIKLILMASVTGKYFSKNLIGYGISGEDIWLHSIAVGIAVEEIAKEIRLSVEKVEGLYIAGILHDIGKIVLDLYTKLEKEEFFKLVQENPDLDFLQIEWLALGVDHGMVGGYLLKKWGFPKEIYFAVRAHHDPDLMLEDRTAAVVALGNILVSLLGIIGGIDSFNYKIPEKLLEVIGVDNRILEKIFPRIYKRNLQIREVLF